MGGVGQGRSASPKAKQSLGKFCRCCSYRSHESVCVCADRIGVFLHSHKHSSLSSSTPLRHAFLPGPTVFQAWPSLCLPFSLNHLARVLESLVRTGLVLHVEMIVEVCRQMRLQEKCLNLCGSPSCSDRWRKLRLFAWRVMKKQMHAAWRRFCSCSLRVGVVEESCLLPSLQSSPRAQVLFHYIFLEIPLNPVEWACKVSRGVLFFFPLMERPKCLFHCS